VRFIVCKDGSLCEIKAEKKGQTPLKAEAERVIRNSPNWIPAVVKGKTVKAYRRQPITFQFEQE
jgi:protein TonB